MDLPVSKIGDAPKRREDMKFLTGRGAYLDDLLIDRMCHAVFWRSPVAHARIDSIEVLAARDAPGVIAVLTIDDVKADELSPLMPGALENPKTGKPFKFLPQPLLADGVVRHVGEPVAVVIAETLDLGLDALDLIDVEFTLLDVVTTAAAARAATAPILSADAPGNVCLHERYGDRHAVEAAVCSAAHVVELELENPRIVTNPMEPRGVIGQWDSGTGRYTLHVSSQNIHGIRDVTAQSLGVDPSLVRLVAPDVGGAFGVKNFAYCEMPLLAWCGRRAGRPVKWIATRSEMFLADHQARAHSSKARLALDAKGRFLALDIESAANIGAYMVGSCGLVQATLFSNLAGTVYDVPAISVQILAIYSNTPPLGVTRAPGFSEAGFIMERLIDTAARECCFDAVELRRQNFFRSEDMPISNALGQTVDSGNFAACLDMVWARSDAAGFASRQAESKERGLLRGIGLAYQIKATGGSPQENVEIKFEDDGTVTLITGTQTIGQGHETSFPQIVSELLGVPDSEVTLVDGDTDRIPTGGGHGSSRSTYMAGTSIWRAAQEIIEKASAFASDALEAAPQDVCFGDGSFTVAGTDRSIGLLEVARIARDAGVPLDTYNHWTREHMTFPNGAHVVEVEIDPETGMVQIARYTLVDDYGVLINPMLVRGQTHGATAQGIGQALLERAVVDPDSGQPLAASFMDYALPRADDLPFIDTNYLPTPCTTNPLGVKGAGEAAIVGAPAAIANAVVDALWSLGVRHFDGAASPERIWRAIKG
ncbi:MAG: xanthine dehydrogenase family protein molybdopterin-binding subunit [Pseudomonadota bacterium]